MTIKYANCFEFTWDTNSAYFNLYKGTTGDFILFASAQITCPNNSSKTHLISQYFRYNLNEAELVTYKPFNETAYISGYIVIAHA